MSITKEKPKKKLSVAIKQTNFKKIENIKKKYPSENTSSIIDASLDFSLEEVEELLGKPLDFQEENRT